MIMFHTPNGDGTFKREALTARQVDQRLAARVPAPRRYKAIMHFNKPGAAKGTPWTVHFRGACYVVREIVCKAPIASEWKPNRKANPRAFFTAQVATVTVDRRGKATLA